ncbi:Ger(x)C family spore germination protein [Paenibacillus sp. YYML68]|uniref:Ger(x)C family spore germination protein n=1 Tax=Paenibacillus sp. YYML68 TaxID=2909250 RepID=UPI002492937C|nr:Ger(x)C family spore germination protein [Paenibacillus sp. YYML68]
MTSRTQIIIAVLSLLMLFGMLSGCGYKDIDKRLFAVSIGVDKVDNEDKPIHVIVKLAIPSGQVKVGQEAFILVKEEGRSISEAMRVIKSKIDKELDFSHAKAIILGEELVKSNVDEWVDWFIRRRDVQKIAWVGVGKPDAAAVLELKPKSERIPSNAVFLTFGSTGTESAYIASEYMFDFRRRLEERGLDPILPILEVIKDPELIEVNKAAVFDKKKQRLSLSPEQVKYYHIMANRMERSIIQAELDGDTFYLDTDESKASYRFNEEKDRRLTIEVKLELEGTIEETHAPIRIEQLSAYKQAVEATVHKEALGLLKLLQKEKLDPIGLGLRYRARSFSEDDWEQWQQLYPEARFEVKVDYVIQSTGVLSTSD